MKNTFLAIIFLFLSFNSLAVDIPSRDGLNDSEKKHFKKQKKILKERGYRFGDNKLATKISNKIKTHSICEDYKVDDGVSTGLFGIKLKVGIDKKSVFNYDYILANNKSELGQLPPNCRKNFLEAYKNYKAENDKDTENEYCLERDCELVSNANDIYIQNVEALEASFTPEDQVVIQRIICQEQAAAQAVLDKENAAAEIVRMLSLVKDVSDCTPLEVGESRVTSKNDRLADYVEQKYAVTNIGNDTYRVDLNINFIPEDFPGASSQTSADMIARMKGCVEKSSSSSMDKLGRKLKFNILTPSEAEKLPEGLRPPQVDIKVTGPNVGRQSSRTYNSNASCAVMIHEMMHLMGLHDEYKENQIGTYTHKDTKDIIKYYNDDGSTNTEGMKIVSDNREDYDVELSYQCRATPPKNTIMKNTHSFFPSVVKEATVCDCSSVDEAKKSRCQKIISQSQDIRESYLRLNSSRIEMIPGLREYCTIPISSPRRRLFKLEDIKYYKLVSILRRSDRSISFLKSQVSLFDDGTTYVFPSTRVCSCPEGDENCMSMLNTINGIAEDMTNVKTSKCPLPSKVLREGGGKVTDPLNQALFNIPAENFESAPLFENAHVEKVLFPGCDSRGEKYVNCLGGAYSEAGAVCSDKPAYCSENSFLEDI